MMFMEILSDIDNIINNIMNNMGAFAPILACLLILVESMLPILPTISKIIIKVYAKITNTNNNK